MDDTRHYRAAEADRGQSLIDRAAGLAKGEGLRGELVRGGMGSVIVNVAYVGLSLAASVFLGRALGARGYGTYAFVFALVSILAVPLQQGLGLFVLRETAKAEAEGKSSVLGALWRWADLGVGAVFLPLLAASMLAFFTANRFGQTQIATFAWGLMLLPLMAFGSLRGAALRGLRKVIRGQLPDFVIRPGLLALILGGALLFKMPLTPALAMAAHAAAAAVAIAIGVWLLNRARPSASRDNIAFQGGLSRHWTTSALSFGFTAAVQAINSQATIVVLGLLRPAADVGIYQVATQASAVLSFGLVAVNVVCAPQYTRFCAQRDVRRLQGVAVHSARASLAVAGVGFLVVVLLGDRILGLLFGPEFRAAYGIMIVLSCAQLVNVAMGSVGILLGMSGHERLLAKVTAISAVLNIVLSVALIEGYGREGAAIAAATSIIFVNVVLWRMVQVKLGVDSSVLGSVGTRTAARMGNAD